MNKLAELRRKRAALVADFKSLVMKEGELPDGESLPDDDSQRMAAIEADVAAHDGRISRLEILQELEAGTAVDPESDVGGEKFVGTIRVKAGSAPAEARKQPLQGKGFQAARFVIGELLAKTEGRERASRIVGERFNDFDVVKALNTVGVATGGALIPQDFANEIIELLTARVVVRASGAATIEMPRGNLTIPRLSGGATASYLGELDDIPMSQPTFDDIQLNAKKLTSLVPITNDLLRRAPIGVERIVTDNMIMAMAMREDIAFLRGDGTTNSPVGLLNQCLPANKLVGNALPTDPNAVINAVAGILTGMMLTLTNSMSRMINPGWIFTPTILQFLMNIRGVQANTIYAEELLRGTLYGIPFRTTTQIPSNLAIVTGQTAGVVNNSEIYLADFADVILGDTMEMRVDTSNEATYKDSGGNVVSAYQRDQTLFRVITEHDLGVRHKGSVAVAIVPAWAPAGYAGFNSGTWFYAQAANTLGSAAGSAMGATVPTGSNNPGNSSAAVAGGTLPGLAS